MKNHFFLLITILLTPFFFSPVQAEFQKTKIAVLDFRQQGNNFDNEDMGKIVAEWLITAFVKEGRFEVIERKLLGEVLEEQQMVEAGIVNQDTASEIGKLLGVKVIISGSVARIGQTVEVNARIVDVTSASIITAESVNSTNVSSLRELVGEMAGKIMKNFPLEGYIVHRMNNEIVIDLGLQAGVKEGMVFLVYQEGEVVKHPKTDEILHVGKIKTGLVKITAIQEKISIGTILEEIDSESIAPGDLVTSTKSGETGNLPKKAITPVASTSKSEPYQGTAVAQQQLKTVPATGQIFVDVIPPTARVRILNIVQGYYPGISLPVGKYEIEVSVPGYQTRTEWYSLSEGEVKHLAVTLDRNVPPAVASPPVDSALQGYLDKLYSKDSGEVRAAAKHLHMRYRNNIVVIAAAHDVLQARFTERANDNNFIDAMAYLCNILGESGQSRHRSLLVTINREAGNFKLRSYATKNISRLDSYSSSTAASRVGPVIIPETDVSSGNAVSSPAGVLRFAILPWDPKSSSWFGIVLDNIVKTIKKYPELTLSHSYYKLFNEHEVRIIDSGHMGAVRPGDLWQKKNVFSFAIPDTGKVAEIGKRLGVDRIIMGRYSLREYGPITFMEYLYVYVVNVHDHSIQEFKSNSSSDLYMGDYDIITNTVSETFREMN